MTDRELSTIDETCGAPELYFTLNLRGQPENSAMAQVFINNLNIKPLDRSIKEVVDCFSCAWHKKHTHKIGLVDDMMPRSLLKPEKQRQQVEPLFKRFELCITAHYPTIFFFADETDPLTRALVLRGRAVVKMTT
jgi:hypothetical protein